MKVAGGKNASPTSILFRGPVLAFDLGGTHIAATVMDEHRWKSSVVLSPLQCGSRTDSLLSAIEITGLEALRRVGRSPSELAGVALATPGPFDYTRGLSWMKHKHPALYGIDLRTHLSTSFGVEPKDIAFLNDAKSFLLGEIAHAGLTSSRVVGLTLGTGIGSAFFDHGQILEDDPRVPPGGEVWNRPWEDGTVEDALSTRAISDSFRASTGNSLTVKEIATLASSDLTARRCIQDFGLTLGKITDALCADFAPNHILLGGGISRSASLFLPEMRRALKTVEAQVHVSTLFEDAALYGAAEFWRTERTGCSLAPATA